jgi:predicted nucleic acid-binding protein
MIVADTSVWIDFFNGSSSAQVDRLKSYIRSRPVLMGDLILTEVLQGFRHDRDFSRAQRMLGDFPMISIAGPDIAVQSARNFRRLRAAGVTVRKTIDCLIATRCIEDGHALLFSDRDFAPFVEHLGLEAA